MALRAGYFGLKRFEKNKLSIVEDELSGINKQINSGLLTTLDAVLAAASKPESGNLIYASSAVVSVLTNNALSVSGKLVMFNLTAGTFDWFGMLGDNTLAFGRLSNNQYSSHVIVYPAQEKRDTEETKKSTKKKVIKEEEE